MSIIHALLLWILGVLVPGTGMRRADARPAVPSHVRRPGESRETTAWLPAPRSPYGLDVPLDGASVVAVRPYVAACEREQARQYRRRLGLVLAADFGIDLNRHLIGAEGVA